MVFQISAWFLLLIPLRCVCLYLNILFCSNDLSPIFTLIPYCLGHCSFKISLEVRQYKSPKFGHLFQSYFGYSKPISSLYKFQKTAYQFLQKIHTDFVCSYIEQVDQFREISLLFTCSLIPLNNVWQFAVYTSFAKFIHKYLIPYMLLQTVLYFLFQFPVVYHQYIETYQFLYINFVSYKHTKLMYQLQQHIYKFSRIFYLDDQVVYE